MKKINILDENNEKKSHKVYGVKYRFYDDKNQEIKFLISKIDNRLLSSLSYYKNYNTQENLHKLLDYHKKFLINQ